MNPHDQNKNDAGFQRMQPAKMVNGIRLSYQYFDHLESRHTVLLLHGFLSSSFSFRKVIPLLNQHYRIVAVDFPPFGESGTDPHFHYSCKNISATIIDLIEDLKVERLYFAGHSLGGQIGLQMAYQKPDLFEKMVLLSPSGYLKRTRKSLIWTSYLPFFHFFVKRKLVKSGGVEGNLKQVVYDRSIITEEMIRGYMDPFIKDNSIYRALGKFLRDRGDDLSVESLRTIRIPCLLLWGKYDRIVPLDVAKRYKEDLLNSELVVLDHAGHLLPEELPEKTVELMIKFFERDTSS